MRAVISSTRPRGTSAMISSSPRSMLVHGGWDKRRALLYNVLSALTFLAGGLIAYAASFRLDVAFLVPFAAGNFIYIGAADLIPEVKAHADARANVIHFAAFAAGVLLMAAVKLALEA
jgi:zinc and cadmium transporter